MMSLLSSSSNVIHYAVDGEIPISIAGWLFMFGFLGGNMHIFSDSNSLHINAYFASILHMHWTLTLFQVSQGEI